MGSKPDLNIIQSESIGGWCASGHTASEFFKLNKNDPDNTPTRFFKVIGNGINGIYCEPCLILSHQIAKNKKQNLI